MAGLNTVSEDWATVTKIDIQRGVKYNANFVSGGLEPLYFIGDKSITVKKSNQNIKNCTQILAALLKQDDSLTITTFRCTGDEKYTVGKASDIKYVARYIKATLITVTNDYTATLDESVSAKIGKYDNRFLANNAAFNLNDKLICRITRSGFTHLRAFDISGTTITLKDIVTGANSGITGLAVNDTFELINAYNIMEEGLEATTGYPVQGYVKKHVKPGEDTSYITFNSTLDKPLVAYSDNGEKVVIAYNQLDDYNQRFFYSESIDRYGIFTHKEELNAPVTYKQLSYIESTLRKASQPQTTIELETFRPTKPLKGWAVNFDIPGLVQGIFKIIAVSETFIDFNGQLIDKPFRLWKVTLTDQDSNSLARLLASLKRNNDMSKAKLATNDMLKSYISYQLTYKFIDDPAIIGLDTPIALPATSISSTAFTANTTAVTGATGYILYIFTNAGLTTSLLGYTGGVDLGNATTYLVNQAIVASETGPFYYQWKARNSVAYSELSNVITVIKSAGFRDLTINSNTLIYSHYRDSNSNNIANSLKNGLVVNTSVGDTGYTSGIISPDNSCVILNGSNQYIEYDEIALNSSTFTASIALQFVSLKAYQIIIGNYNAPITQFEIEFDNSTKKFRILLYSVSGYIGMANDININFALNTSYLLEFSWDQPTQTFKFYLNGVSQAVSKTEGGDTLAGLVVRNDTTSRMRVGAYNHYGSINSNISGFFPNIKVLRTRYNQESTNDTQATNNYNTLFS